ncbi:MAG TPA: hypothetical protein VNP92_32115 [Actinophytocola sp.]|nr:hypothetical protein [Actinophytocola sp.]
MSRPPGGRPRAARRRPGCWSWSWSWSWRRSNITGALTAALAARPREVWVIRPDAHVAAVLEQPTGPALDTALRRALAALDPSG